MLTYNPCVWKSNTRVVQLQVHKLTHRTPNLQEKLLPNPEFHLQQGNAHNDSNTTSGTEPVRENNVELCAICAHNPKQFVHSY